MKTRYLIVNFNTSRILLITGLGSETLLRLLDFLGHALDSGELAEGANNLQQTSINAITGKVYYQLVLD